MLTLVDRVYTHQRFSVWTGDDGDLPPSPARPRHHHGDGGAVGEEWRDFDIPFLAGVERTEVEVVLRPLVILIELSANLLCAQSSLGEAIQACAMNRLPDESFQQTRGVCWRGLVRLRGCNVGRRRTPRRREDSCYEDWDEFLHPFPPFSP